MRQSIGHPKTAPDPDACDKPAPSLEGAGDVETPPPHRTRTRPRKALLMRHVIGGGKASKTAMIVDARETLGYRGLDDNEADALWLRAIGHAVLGKPLADMPSPNKKAINKLDLPA